MAEEAAMEIIGVSFSAATSIMASEFGVMVEPMMISTLSSAISLRAFFTAVVVSDASSRTMYSTFLPAISFGSKAKVFFSGMPKEAAGPVADTLTPTLICAEALLANTSDNMAGKAASKNRFFMGSLLFCDYLQY